MKQRLFVALDLPDDVRSALPAPGEGWRPVAKASLHVTLAFLGWMEAAEPVIPVVAGAVVPVGELSVAGCVLLPPRRPRVMAVTLAGDAGVLQASVSAALVEAGLYAPEARPWLAHVTIGRAVGTGPAGRVVPSVPALSFVPPSVSVYRSVTAAGGAVYTPLARFALG
jgi:2'-5' RNA ligase